MGPKHRYKLIGSALGGAVHEDAMGIIVVGTWFPIEKTTPITPARNYRAGWKICWDIPTFLYIFYVYWYSGIKGKHHWRHRLVDEPDTLFEFVGIWWGYGATRIATGPEKWRWKYILLCWLGTFFNFFWVSNHPNWPSVIFFRGVQSSNQISPASDVYVWSRSLRRQIPEMAAVSMGRNCCET